MIRQRSLLISSIMVLAASGMSPAGAQVPEKTLTHPDATFPEAFSLVQGLLEMPDGRVLVADPLGQALVLADLASGVADTLGDIGQGPEEYRQPDGVFPLPGDSTLLVDLGNARLTAIGPDGGFGATMPMAQGEPGTGRGFLVVMPAGVDARGRIYFQPFGGGAGGRIPDSAEVVRLDRATGAIDTVARVGRPKIERVTSGGAGSQSVAMRIVPLSPQDAWAVSSDGRIAVARAADYHVEWIGADGGKTIGAPVPYDPVPIEQADKEEWAENAGTGGLAIEMAIENDQRRMSFSRGGAGRAPDLANLNFPAAKPAFVADGVWVTPEGEVWVQRSVPAGQSPAIDIFGDSANLKGKLTLPAGRRIVGFGQGVVYAVRTDEFGLQWLERYKTTS